MTVMTRVRANPHGLAAALRYGTRDAHRHAEGSPFVRRLLTGVLPMPAYTGLVAQNYAIYTALERLGETWRHDPVAGPFMVDELTRMPSLCADLAGLLGPDWAAQTGTLVEPATLRYVSHLEDVAGHWAAGFVAHHYVRYLGDLSGGQVLRAAVRRHYPGDGAAATRFYTFDRIPAVKVFRDHYRHLLDAAPIGVFEQRRIVNEAVIAFALNRAVFDDLAGRYC